MNRTIHALAFAGKCGALGASGDAAEASRSAPATVLAKNPSVASKVVSAVPTNPPPASHRNSRRVRPQGVKARGISWSPPESPSIRSSRHRVPRIVR